MKKYGRFCNGEICMANKDDPCTYQESLEKISQLRQSIYSHTMNIRDFYVDKQFKNMNSELKKLYDENKKLIKEEKYLTFPPAGCSLPFFAYGIFKPNQLAYPRIKDYVLCEPIKCSVKHALYERDGIPFVSEKDKSHKTQGYVIYFKEDYSELAYDIIRKTESAKFYRWETIDSEYGDVNILFGRNPSRSTPSLVENESYDGRKDVFFTHAMNLISQEMKDYEYDDDFENFFKLQRNYLLLWTCIERYTSLKYGENTKTFNNHKLAQETIFKDSLKYYVKKSNEKRKIFDSQTLNDVKLDPENPIKSIDYYYTMRSNVVHRGKSVSDIDEKKLRKSLVELLNIFQCVLKETFKDITFATVDIEVGEKEK